MNRNEDRGMILGDWPASAAAVDAKWLDSALRQSGVVSTATVRSVSAANLGLGVGIIGEVSRLSIAYDKPEPGVPTGIIAKTGGMDVGNQRGLEMVRAVARRVDAAVSDLKAGDLLPG
jgi:hypothetical protein